MIVSIHYPPGLIFGFYLSGGIQTETPEQNLPMKAFAQARGITHANAPFGCTPVLRQSRLPSFCHLSSLSYRSDGLGVKCVWVLKTY
jgi:hypothetical protein